MELNDKAKKVFQLKYAKNKTKTWKEACRKIADFMAQGESPYAVYTEDIERKAEEFYEELVNLRMIPGGRIIANAGTGIKNLANCFVLPLDDSRQSIYDTLKNAAEVFAMGGGVGYSFNKVREEGAYIHSTGGKASGPLSFLTLFDQTGEVIQQASRRGAQLASLDISHPDIEKFIGFKSTLNSRNSRLMQEYDRNLKGINGSIKDTKYEKVLEKTLLDDQLTHFNISVLLTDDFMKAVEEDGDWNLISPKTKEVIRTVKAKDLLYKMAKQAWESGDPGELFYDRINQDNLVPYIGNITATNPCFTADTSILTEDGYNQIGTLSNFESVNLVDANGNVVKGKTRNTGIKKVYQLNLSTNKKIKCTANHIFMSVSGEEVEAVNSKGVQLKPYLKYPTLDNHFTLLGFIQGDGTLGRLKSKEHLGVEINIGGKDKDILPLLDGHKYTVGSRKVYLQDIKDELIEMGFDSNKLPERVFPYQYVNWNQEQRAAFLRGCFSANGTINNYGRICYKATSRKFIEQLQGNLDVQFGISSYITTNKSHPIKFWNGTYVVKESYDLNISDFESKTIFFNKINFVQKYKIDKFEKLMNEISPFIKSIKYLGEEDVYDFYLPDYHWGVVEGFVAHNCGEVPLLEGESCILTSKNLYAFYNKETKEIDYEALKNTVKIATRFLEDVTEITEAPVDYINTMTKNLRRLGLGVMGFADLLVALDIPYESDEAVELSEYLSWFISYHAWVTSYELAKERGAFGYYDKDKINFDVVYKTLYDNPYHTFEVPFEELKNVGLRNVSVTSLAPTGSIAIIGGVNSGIEPFFALAYKRNITEGVGNIATDSLFEINPALENKLKEFGYSNQEILDIVDCSVRTGSLQNCNVDPKLKQLFKTANEISWEYHIKIQAAWQKYTSNAISKTINIPEEATVEDIFNIYLEMWKAGLKGGTIYRDKSKSFQILERPKE